MNVTVNREQTPPPIETITLTLTVHEALILSDLCGSIGGYGEHVEDMLCICKMKYTPTQVRDDVTTPIYDALSVVRNEQK